MTTGCGRLTKGSHPSDDLVPCGTKLHLGTKATHHETRLLCAKCKGESDGKDS